MKPLIIQVPSGKKDEITLTVKELQDMLDKAYEAGKSDGSYIHYDCPHRWNCNWPSITWCSNGSSGNDYTKIYCGDGTTSTTTTTTAWNGNCDCKSNGSLNATL